MGRGHGAGPVLATIVVSAFAACGGGSDGGGDGRAVAGLVDRLPEDAPRVASMDVAAYREALDLAEDQGFEDGFDDRSRPLLFALSDAVPFLADPRSTPISEAFDTGAVTAVASVPVAFDPDRGVVVVRTDQSFEDLAGALEDQGYERDGDVVATDQPPMRVGGVTVAASAGDDVVVLATSTELARSVAGGEGDGPALAGALGSVEGPFRMALAAPDGESCVATVAAGWQVAPAEGEVEVTLTDAAADGADAEALLSGDLPPDRQVELVAPEVDGATVRAGFRTDTVGSPFGFMSSEATLDDIYRC